MIRFNVISLFPDFFEPLLSSGVVGRAIKKDLVSVEIINPRLFTTDVHQTVDDRPFGGGDGMVMGVEPLAKALDSLREAGRLGTVVYLSPQGLVWNDDFARGVARGSGYERVGQKVLSLSKSKDGVASITLVCGRYAGVDFRFIQKYVDVEISIGDYVLSGGEIPALVVIDSVARFIPGVLGNEASPHNESFSDGLLEAPQFTRPREWAELTVPEALLSGDHKRIAGWRRQVSLLRTALIRPDLIESGQLKDEVKKAVIWAAGCDQAELLQCGLSSEELKKIEENWDV